MSTLPASVWQEATRRLREEITEEDFETWFDSVQLVRLDATSALLRVPSEYRGDIIRELYGERLCGTLRQITGREINLDFEITSEPGNTPPAAFDRRSRDSVNLSEDEVGCPLNFRYTFDTFVIGESNRLAHAAALSVAKAPGRTYNPLFIHGGVGLGKTHVIQAVGHFILSHHPSVRVAYIPAETFVGEFIESIQENRRNRFQKKYRNVDVLLIDDIHFLAGKESTQEEFFHTFNALHNQQKQIVLTSDRPPRDIPTLEDRLRSRFEWGLITDIQYPELETRTAILRKKCELEGIELPEEVTLYIADRVRSSIRELEGALIKVAASAQWTDTTPTVEMAARALGKLSIHGRQEVSIERIQKKVADHFRIKTSDILGDDRSRSVTFPRQIAMYLSRQLTRHSYPEIGAFFGGKDHTTVLHAYRRIETELTRDEDFRSFIERLKIAVCQPD
jgi:chromosomal replication initiator protein